MRGQLGSLAPLPASSTNAAVTSLRPSPPSLRPSPPLPPSPALPLSLHTAFASDAAGELTPASVGVTSEIAAGGRRG